MNFESKKKQQQKNIPKAASNSFIHEADKPSAANILSSPAFDGAERCCTAAKAKGLLPAKLKDGKTRGSMKNQNKWQKTTPWVCPKAGQRKQRICSFALVVLSGRKPSTSDFVFYWQRHTYVRAYLHIYIPTCLPTYITYIAYMHILHTLHT